MKWFSKAPLDRQMADKGWRVRNYGWAVTGIAMK
jgi:hypothetical protein